jgi:mono/diheme cytochrome c family protein
VVGARPGARHWWLLAVLAAGCVPLGRPDPADRPVPENQVRDFGALYATNCAGCHGADGKLGPAPPLNDPLFLAIVSDATLERVITHGRPGTPMPAFAQDQGGPLTAEQVKILAGGIKPRWAGGGKPDAQVPPYLAAGAGDKDRGAKLFGRTCAGCHGDEGDGGGGAGPINNPAFLALLSDQVLRRIIITGRPDLGMPDYTDGEGRALDFRPLTSAEVADLVAYVGSLRRPAEFGGKSVNR